MNIPDIIIAIDGFSSTGKSSFAKLIAREFGFRYLDSGALYRGVTLYAVEHGLIGDDGVIDTKALGEALPGIDLNFRSEKDGSKTYLGSRCIEKEIRGLFDAGLTGGYTTWLSSSNIEKYRSQADAFKIDYYAEWKRKNGR